MDTFHTSVILIMGEWAEAGETSFDEILRRVCVFGKHGLVFDDFTFRRVSDGVFIGILGVQQVLGKIQSFSAIARKDGITAYQDLGISTRAVRDFCRVTRTRPPDSALMGQRRGDWLNYEHLAPPNREPTADELQRMHELYRSRWEAEKSKEQQHAAAAKTLSAARGSPSHQRSLPRSHREPMGSGGGSAAQSATPIERWPGHKRADEVIIARVLKLMAEHNVSAWGGLGMIPDEDLPGTGTAKSRRERIHRRIKKNRNR